MSLAFDLENNLIDLRSARIFSPENRTWEELDTIPAELVPVSETDAVTRLQQQGGRCRVPVGILGGKKASEEQLADALGLGTLIGQMGLTLICGGRQGVMEAACKGATEAGGICVGLLPDENPDTANPYVTIPLATGIGVARNAILTRAALCLVAVGGGYGTLSEIAFGLQFEKRVFGLSGAPNIPGMFPCRSPKEAAAGIARVVLNLP
ncbi:TIGR00725 family protein [uncultured Desulfobacter sp.]|uniref:TIGR00725 family protein n=1 Tax=uncultured Desulfobacter sp. TaxID=240139 RepID=UPI0029C9A327|nr:TIGR00725 family protein [uncultured Desulfobacter sp.]